MIFGKVDNPELVDFTLPVDHPQTKEILQNTKKKAKLDVYVGCAKWNRTDLKGFYPRGIKDELGYYATKFNSIELNATFYGIPSVQQVETWANKTAGDFKFFPKITNTISHYKRLKGVESLTEEFCMNVSNFGTKLGMVFLQLHDNFSYKDFDKLKYFIEKFPKGIPLALELRNNCWFNDFEVSDELYPFLKGNKITNIIVDTAGRRDLLHMHLTTPTAFVRYVGANHSTDYSRLDDWIERIKVWIEYGLENLYFFIHQNIEKESPLLANYFINKLNKQCALNIRGPGNGSLF